MKEILEKLKNRMLTINEYSESDLTFFNYTSELNKGREKHELNIPIELSEFYYEADGGTLFKDDEYGQWGLKIYSFEELKEMNEYARTWKDNLEDTDLVIGEFLGDLDLLIISHDKKDYGQVSISIPHYDRKDWYNLHINFKEFLSKYIESDGNKFWEMS